MSDREELVFKAKLAEQAERYDDMTYNMKKVATMDTEMTVEERNLLSVAYKNVIGVKRSSWRVVTAMMNSKDSNADHEGCAKEYKKKIEEELRNCCKDVLETLNTVISKSTSPESKVFYYKMQGDYYRYMAEFCVGDERKEVSNQSSDAYSKADELAKVNLSSTDPIRLGLALNFSVFFYEIMRDQAKATSVAKSAFDTAISELDSLEDSSYKDSTLIMQLLRDNLTLWSHNTDEDKQKKEDEDDEQEQC